MSPEPLPPPPAPVAPHPDDPLTSEPPTQVPAAARGTDWMRHAACARGECDPEWWFQGEKHPSTDLARWFCLKVCVVRPECRRYARRMRREMAGRGGLWGLWGGDGRGRT